MSLRIGDFPWTPDSEATLRALYADGLSFADIAKKMRHGLTRSAIAGKCARLRLTRGKPNGGWHNEALKTDALRAEFRALWLSPEWTVTAIATRFGVSGTLPYKWARDMRLTKKRYARRRESASLGQF